MTLLQPRINYKLSANDYWTLISSFFKKESRPSNLEQLFINYEIHFFDKARNGLRFILQNIGIENARVGVQVLTCPTVIEAIYLAKCNPVFIDITSDYIISEIDLKNKLDSIDVLILTHTFGINANASEIKSILKNKILIEDCAHAFLTLDNDGHLVGNIGDFSLFSFGFGKFPTAISGGFICVSQTHAKKYNHLYNSLRESISISKQLTNIIKSIILPLLNKPFIYTFFTVKLKKRVPKPYFKPTNSKLQLAYYKSNKSLFLKKLINIYKYQAQQNKNATVLIEAATLNSNYISISNKLKDSNNFLLALQVDNADLFIETARKKGIEVGKQFVKTKEIIGYYGYKLGDCVNYEQIIKNLITLPTHYNYPTSKVTLLAKTLTNYKPI